MALHQSRSLKESLNHVARPVWTHSSLFSCAGQNGEFAPVYRVVLGTDCCFVRDVEDSSPPPDGKGMFPRLVPAMHS